MEKENKNTAQNKEENKKHDEKKEKNEDKEMQKIEERSENKTHEKIEEKKTEEKKIETKKKKEEKKPKRKREAVAYGTSYPISKKHSMYIGRMIKNHSIEDAIKMLEQVQKFKRAVPFKGEIPHRKNLKGGSGRYPIKASYYFIKLLKGLRGNSIVNGMDLDKTKIIMVSASWASRPKRSLGKATRTNIILRAREIPIVEAKK